MHTDVKCMTTSSDMKIVLQLYIHHQSSWKIFHCHVFPLMQASWILILFFFFFLQNLSENPKCSLLVAKDPEDRTDTVITVYGDATPVMLQILACLYP